MKPFVLLLSGFCLAAHPTVAQESAPDPESDFEEGFSLLEEGTKLLLRGLLSEMEPALRELEGALRELDAYHPPEVLPNGDIIIRRKVPLAPEDEIGEDGEVEL
jgi:hypothetical protein